MLMVATGHIIEVSKGAFDEVVLADGLALSKESDHVILLIKTVTIRDVLHSVHLPCLANETQRAETVE